MSVKKGDAVKVHYKGTFTDGSVFDSSEGKEPLAFTIGQGHVIPGFENAVEGMEIGETKTVDIGVNDAYGNIIPEAIIEIPVGQRLVLLNPETGEPMPVNIIKAENGVLTIDGNHPLAGKDLKFEITLDSIDNNTDHCKCNCGCK